MTLLVNIPAISINGSSVVDYITAEPNIFDKTNYLQVLPRTTYSDHCQIIANCDIKPLNPTNVSKKSYDKTPGQFKWDSSSKQKINSYLRSHDFTKAVTILKQNLESSTSGHAYEHSSNRHNQHFD